MSLILGMDTGGTYTDGVVVDSVTKEILCKAKALTTKQDLTVGIKNCMENMDFNHFHEVNLVSLSTTLATNAIVEGRGCKVGLVLIGEDLEEETSAEYCIRLQGRFDMMGRSKEDLDEELAKEQLKSFLGKVEAIAISGYASVRNPHHEVLVRNWVDQLLGVPTVCAHELTSALGFYQRTVTAVLNARLLPIIGSLIDATKRVLDMYKVEAPLMIVKGDGTLMPESLARIKPIETILSGPAASVMGGAFLTGKTDGFILDMGGTTTDLAYIKSGVVKIKEAGAKVGGWMTRVRAAEISTFGLGGDSHIFLNSGGKIEIGPEKAIPLSLVGKDYPNLAYEMRSFQRQGEYQTYAAYEADCYLLLNDSLGQDLCEQDQKITEILRDAPHSLSYIGKLLGKEPEKLDLLPLIQKGILGRISVTPTDILHVQGRYIAGNEEVARVGVEILAKRMELSVKKFTEQVEKLMKEKLCMTVFQSLCDFDGVSLNLAESKEAMHLIQKIITGKGQDMLQFHLAMQKPIIAIGAPVMAWALPLSDVFGAEVMVPEHAEVANAIGAAVGQVMEVVEIEIHIDEGTKQYILNTPWERTQYKTLEETMFYAIHLGRQHIERTLFASGCSTYEIVEDIQDVMVDVIENEEKVFAGRKIKITGMGKLN
ncbi:MAG: hydantoinase/oxoprolinase family protein [Anaerovorax sp.]